MNVPDAVAAGSTERAFQPDALVVAEGDPPGAFFIVLDGEFEVTASGPSGPRPLGVLTTGDWFGEEALLRGGPRTATVRARVASRCLEVPRDVFERHIATDGAWRNVLMREADTRLAERSLRSLAFFATYSPDEEIDGAVTRRAVAAGAVVFALGAPAASVAFVLDGIARVVGPDGIDKRRCGPGQCAGEDDVVRGGRRAHAVIADTALTVLEVRAERFRAWLDRDTELRDWVGTLQHMYRIAGGRTLAVYEAVVDGAPCAVTVFGDPSANGVMSTDRIGADHLTIARCRQGDGPTETVRHEDGDRLREMTLAEIVRSERGILESARLVALEVRGTGPDVGQLYRRLVTGDRVTLRDRIRFEKTGHLGGTTRASEKALLCQCLQIAADDVPPAQSVEEVQRATGAGMVCKGCVPAIAGFVVNRAAPPASKQASAIDIGEVDVPEIRPLTFRFVAEPLKAIRHVPEALLIAVTSVLSTPAEQLVITALGDAAPLVSGDLAEALEALLAQESNHIAAHAPLNALLLTEIYPESRRLRRLGERMLARYRSRPLKERLAIGAAYEYASDCIFAAFYELHYREGRRFHRDPAVHDAIVASGVGAFYSWHALEELSHRHVAFDVAVALGVSRRELRRGLRRVLGDLVRLQFPVFLELLARDRKATLARFLYTSFVNPGIVRMLAARLTKWVRRDFDPGAIEYPFLAELAADVDRGEPPRDWRAH